MNAQAIVDDLNGLRDRVPDGCEEIVDCALALIAEQGEQIRELRWLVGRRYARKSEKIAAGQLALAFIEQLLASAQSPEDAKSDDQKSEPSKPKHAGSESSEPRTRRKTRIDLLPVEVREVKPDPQELHCAEHGKVRRELPPRVERQVVYEPARLYVLEQHIYEYVCDFCDEEPVCGDVTPTLVPGSLASSSLLSHLVVSKVVDATPLERVARQLARIRAEFATARLYDWFADAAEAAKSIGDAARKRLLKSYLTSLDDTVFPFQTSEREGLKRGRIWVYIGDVNDVAYCQFTTDWKGCHPQAVLKGFKGVVQNDGYGGIDALFTGADGPRRAGCSDHARRKILAAAQQGDDRADPLLDLYKILYAIERRARKAGLTPEQLLEVRHDKSLPVWNELDDRLRSLSGHVSKKCPLGKAITYWVNQYAALSLFLEDGRVPIANIHVEQLIRTIALCRKNSLYIGSVEAGQRYATLLTLALNCTLHGVNPYLYFRDTFDHLARGWPARLIDDLLPQAWRPA